MCTTNLQTGTQVMIKNYIVNATILLGILLILAIGVQQSHAKSIEGYFVENVGQLNFPDTEVDDV